MYRDTFYDGIIQLTHDTDIRIGGITIMKTSFRKGEIILASMIIVLLGAAAFLTMTRTENPAVPQSFIHQNVNAWAAAYNEAEFSSPEIRELVRQLQDISRTDRDPDKLRPVIIKLGVHLRHTSDPVPPVVADLLRDLSVEHPARDIRLMAYTTMINALQNEAGDDVMAIGFASR